MRNRRGKKAPWENAYHILQCHDRVAAEKLSIIFPFFFLLNRVNFKFEVLPFHYVL